jgi:hypothetical protein
MKRYYEFRVLAFGLTLILSGTVMADPRVYFNQSNYNVSPGGSVSVSIRIDGDSIAAGDQSVTNGLYAYGVRASFPAANAAVAPGSITVPAELDFNGFSAGASKSIGSGFAEVLGNVDQSPFPSVNYTGNLLSSFTLNDLTLAPGNYQLSLGLHSLAGNKFIDGEGNPLDSSIQFGTATVTVVPEPMAMSLLSLCGILIRTRAIK